MRVAIALQPNRLGESGKNFTRPQNANDRRHRQARRKRPFTARYNCATSQQEKPLIDANRR
jgi:hypothetical protein